jgi:hypothetical protein
METALKVSKKWSPTKFFGYSETFVFQLSPHLPLCPDIGLQFLENTEGSNYELKKICKIKNKEGSLARNRGCFLEECLRKLERDGDSNIRREAEQFSNLHFLYKACLTRESLRNMELPTGLKATPKFLEPA